MRLVPQLAQELRRRLDGRLEGVHGLVEPQHPVPDVMTLHERGDEDDRRERWRSARRAPAPCATSRSAVRIALSMSAVGFVRFDPVMPRSIAR